MKKGIIIDHKLAGKLVQGWRAVLIANGRVYDGLGNILIDPEDICKVIVGGEVDFYCDTGKEASDFIKTLLKTEESKIPTTGMSCETQGALKSRQERIEEFKTRNQTIPCETHRRINCADCPVP